MFNACLDLSIIPGRLGSRGRGSPGLKLLVEAMLWASCYPNLPIETPRLVHCQSDFAAVEELEKSLIASTLESMDFMMNALLL